MSYLNAKPEGKSLLNVDRTDDWSSLIIDGVEYVPAKARNFADSVEIVTETFIHFHDVKKAIKNMEERLGKYENWLKERP